MCLPHFFFFYLSILPLRQLVFSSSCTVYGMAEKVPLTEDCSLHACSPYGRTKLMQEEILG